MSEQVYVNQAGDKFVFNGSDFVPVSKNFDAANASAVVGHTQSTVWIADYGIDNGEFNVGALAVAIIAVVLIVRHFRKVKACPD